MTLIAALGHLTRDVVAGGEPRPGGGVFWSTRALAHLGADAVVSAACSAEDRTSLVPPLEAFGLPVTWVESSATTAYSFHYEGDRRIMWQDAVGDPWTPEQAVEAAADALWINVCALTRTDFPADTLAALAADGRQLLVDLQGLVRTATVGPLHTDEHIGDVLRHVEVLKLNDEEAETLIGSADPERLHSLAVPEVVLTLGSKGAWVVTPTSSSTCRPSRWRVTSTRREPATPTRSPTSSSVPPEPSPSRRLGWPRRRCPRSSRPPRDGTRRVRRRRRARRSRRPRSGRRGRAHGQRAWRAADLDALRDLDPLPPIDELVPAEVAGDRAGSRSRRGILPARPEHARLPAAAEPAMQFAGHPRIGRSRTTSGESAATASSLGKRDDDVRRTVVVDLDRGPSARCRAREEASSSVIRLDGRDWLLHAPERESRPTRRARPRPGTSPGAGLELDDTALERLREHPGRPEDRDDPRTASRDRVEDSDASGASLLGGQHERRLREADLERERLHRLRVDLARVGEDGELISLERGCR